MDFRNYICNVINMLLPLKLIIYNYAKKLCWCNTFNNITIQNYFMVNSFDTRSMEDHIVSLTDIQS